MGVFKITTIFTFLQNHEGKYFSLQFISQKIPITTEFHSKIFSRSDLLIRNNSKKRIKLVRDATGDLSKEEFLDCERNVD